MANAKFTIIYFKLIYAYMCYMNIYDTYIFSRTFMRNEHKALKTFNRYLKHGKKFNVQLVM